MFFDRESETAQLFRYFKRDKNVLMLAPRRVGKTELLHRIAKLAEPEGFRAIVFDMEGYREEKDFFQELCSAIQEELGTGASLMATATDRLKKLISGTNQSDDWRQILLKSDWREFAGHLLAVLEAENSGRQWLIMVDELPIFINELLKASDGRERASTFLYWLRNARQKYRKLRWLYTGSIGLDSVSRREDMEGALLDLELFSLKPFSRDTATDYLGLLAKESGYQFAEGAVDCLLNGLGWLSPYYLEKLADQSFARHKNNSVDIPAAEAALEAMLGLESRTYWAAWREHLTKNFTDPERGKLFQVLEVIARHGPQSVSRDSLLANLGDSPADLARWLDTLESDGYLVADTERQSFQFQMNLLRLWWLRYVVSQH